MLRIHLVREAGGSRVGVEGRLAGPWVRELGSCWEALLAERRPGTIRVDLHGVSFIDAAGKAL